jgi:hypothetical protein
MSIRKIIGFISAFMYVIVSGCTHAITASSPETLEPTRTTAPTLTPTIKITPTPGYIQYYCPDITTTSHLQDVGIVYGDILGGKTYLWNTDTGQRTIVSEEGFTNWGYAMTSQDHQYIAYFAFSDTEWLDLLKVMDAKGEVINSFVKKGNSWWKLIQWRGHELMLNYYFPDYGPYRIQILDPFSGRSTRITPDYPDIYVSQYGVYGWGASALNASVYNNDLKNVVYYTNDQNVVLYDIGNEKILWKIHDVYPYSAPAWSPDDQHIVIEVNQSDSSDHCQLYVINESGSVESTTHFSFATDTIKIMETAWSENGAYVSFLISTQKDNLFYNLGIFNVNTGEVSVYCISTDFDHRGNAVWLADNEHLIFNGLEENNVDTTYLVDIKSHEISILGTNMVTHGWVVGD